MYLSRLPWGNKVHLRLLTSKARFLATTSSTSAGRNDLGNPDAQKLVEDARRLAGAHASPSKVWEILQNKLAPSMPFETHQTCYESVYQNVDKVKPAWIPSSKIIESTNIHKLMTEKGFKSYNELYDWSIGKETRNDFWMESMERIQIEWSKKPTSAFDLSGGVAHATYFPGGKLNIADSCFNKRSAEEPALVYSSEADPRSLRFMSFGKLNRLSNQIANALLSKLQLSSGDSVAICMPMTPESIAIYLGIVKAGCSVVSIAESFSAEEIATRCRLGNAKAIFTQDVIFRGSKSLPLFDKVLEADQRMMKEAGVFGSTEAGAASKAMKIVVVPGLLHARTYPKSSSGDHGHDWMDTDENGRPVEIYQSVLTKMRTGKDSSWHELLQACNDEFRSLQMESMDACNILFSSGTTGEPKAILWSHSTPIKSAIDGYFHHDIHVGDRVAWPTSLGWMMGPWLLFQLINGATIGLFNGIPSKEGFCEFVELAEINVVGVVPSIVKAWQEHESTSNRDWSKVQKFSSTGEASDPDSFLWLMSRVPGYAPVIEYCGGTEISGGVISSTLIQPNVPSMFSTPVLGSEVMIVDQEGIVDERSRYCQGADSRCEGEIVIVPPSIGLSTILLNRNHYDTYYKDMPSGPNGEILRRHGDEIEFVRDYGHLRCGAEPEGKSLPYIRALGRCDDTMNLGGIKVGSVEIERVCNLVPEVLETAAIAVSGPQGGPSKLVVYVVLRDDIDQGGVEKDSLQKEMTASIKRHLNPLFGISDIVITDSLPRTSSNKVMRRQLRDEYDTK